jgi:hypothetical protein
MRQRDNTAALHSRFSSKALHKAKEARARQRGGDSSVAIFPKPHPSSRVGLHEGLVTFLAENDADLRPATPEKIVYPAMLADIPAAFTLSRLSHFTRPQARPRRRGGFSFYFGFPLEPLFWAQEKTRRDQRA